MVPAASISVDLIKFKVQSSKFKVQSSKFKVQSAKFKAKFTVERKAQKFTVTVQKTSSTGCAVGQVSVRNVQVAVIYACP
jgi:hypothetical protein